MKFTQTSLLLWLILVITPSSVSAACTLKDLNWLLGNWQSVNASTVILEHWQKISTDTFEGLGKTFKSDTQTAEESMRLLQMGDELFYLAKVKHNPLPVAFKAEQCTERSALFINDLHDFPKRLLYQRLDDHKLQVKVTDDKDQGFTLLFTQQENKD